MEKKLVKAFNEQIKNEFYSAYLYLAMAAWCEAKNLPGFAHWFKVQNKEETSHGMKMFDFLIDRGAEVELEGIAKPPAEFGTALEAFQETLKHEKKVTALINSLSDLACELDDKAAKIFLQWFITEQVEEEKNANQIIDTLKMIKAEGPALIMLDRELAKRGG
jgi:ferritin